MSETIERDDVDDLEDQLREIYHGDRVKIEWESSRSNNIISAKGTAKERWTMFYLEPDDRDRDLTVQESADDGDLLVRSVGGDDYVPLGELVSVDVLELGEESIRADPLTDPETSPDLDDELDLKPEPVEVALENAGVFELVEGDGVQEESADDQEDDVVDLVCTECGAVVESSPMRLESCIECGGAFEIADGPVSEPAPPETAPKYLREGLERQSAEELREIAAYAEERAAYLEAEAERELEEDSVEIEDVPEEWDADQWDDVQEESDAPSGATLTTKTIDGRDYFYYQWREGSKIKSEYLAPVAPASKN